MKAGLPEDLGPREPGLDQLISVLTTAPVPDELAAEPAALAMFRASLPKAAAPVRWRPRRVIKLAGAVALTLAGGFAAAAYVAVLPAPVQHVAYRVLGLVGVPDAHHFAPGPSRSHPASPLAGPSTSSARGSRPTSAAPRPVQPSSLPVRSASPAPRPGASRSAVLPVPSQLSLTAARYRVVAGGSDNLAGLLSDHRGSAVPGQQLTLLERAAGQVTWEPAGHATTGSDGSAVLTVENLTANSWFRLTGPDGTQSQTVRVIAVPPVSVTVASSPQPDADTLTASSPLAVSGDLAALQIRVGGVWRSLRVHRLSPAGQAAFVVKIRLIGQVYRVALLKTATHGASASSLVVIPPGSR